MGEYSTGEKLGILILAIPMVASILMIDGFVLMKLWNWFIPATIITLPHLGFGQAVGISVLIDYLTFKPDLAREQDTKKTMGYAFFTPLMMLLIGYIVFCITH
jgi:hypothetical protein